MRLKQKKLFQFREFTIEEKSIYVKMKSANEYNEWDVSFEELGFKKVYKSNPRTVNYIVASVTGSVIVLVLFAYIFYPEQMSTGTLYVNLFLWGLVTVIFLLAGRKDEIYLTGGSQNLAFFRSKPDQETVENFIDHLIRRAKERLKAKYTKIDKDLSEEVQLSNFYWLRNIEVISEDEYEHLKTELKTQKLL